MHLLNHEVGPQLFGRKADRLPAYASGGWANAAEIGAQLQSHIDRGGFRAVKMRVGAMGCAAHVSAERVRAARKTPGPGVEIAVDAHGTYTVAEAKRFAHMVEDCDLAWFEEKVSGDDKAGMAEVRAATSVPISAGESECTRFDFRHLAMMKAVDIFQPDPAFCGGITETMRISALASAFNLRFAPHLWAGAPCFFADLHLCTASPAGFTIECSCGAYPMVFDLSETPIAAKGGMVSIPDGPDLGFSLSESVLRAHIKQS